MPSAESIAKAHAALYCPKLSHVPSMTSLKRQPGNKKDPTTDKRLRFHSLPPEWRPVAEIEFNKALTRYLNEHDGMAPSQQKLGSMLGAAASVVRNHRMRQAGLHSSNWKRARMKRLAALKVLNHAGREKNADIRTLRGTNDKPPSKLPKLYTKPLVEPTHIKDTSALTYERPKQRSAWKLGVV